MRTLSAISQRLSCGLLALVFSALATAAGSPADQARELYHRTEYEAALKVLQPLPQKDGAIYHLMGMCYYMEGDPKKALDYFQKAVELSPGDSDYRLWLGRAWGRRAETSSFVTAPGYASKARNGCILIRWSPSAAGPERQLAPPVSRVQRLSESASNHRPATAPPYR